MQLGASHRLLAWTVVGAMVGTIGLSAITTASTTAGSGGGNGSFLAQSSSGSSGSGSSGSGSSGSSSGPSGSGSSGSSSGSSGSGSSGSSSGSSGSGSSGSSSGSSGSGSSGSSSGSSGSDVRPGEGPTGGGRPGDFGPGPGTPRPQTPQDRDGDGLVDGTSGFVPAVALPVGAALVELALVPARVVACLAEIFTLGYAETAGLCGDVVWAGTGEFGTSATRAPTNITQVDIYVHNDIWYVVPRVRRQLVWRTIAVLLLLVAMTGVFVEVSRATRRQSPPAPPPPVPPGPGS